MKHISALLLLLPTSLWAQKTPPTPPADAPTQLVRTELLLDPNENEVLVQPVPTDTAVVLLVRQRTPKGHKMRYVFQHYGANLHLRREQDPNVADEWDAERLCAEPGVVYALFRQSGNTSKLLVAAYDVRGGQTRTQSFDTKLCRRVLGFKALNGQLFVNVTLTDDQHQTVLLLDVATGQFQFLPYLYEPLSSELTSVADRPAGRAEFILTQNNGRKQRLMLKQLSAEHGELLHSELVQTESERTLLTAQLSPLQDTSARLLAGTYGLRDTQYAQGLFVTDLLATDPGSPTEVTRRHALRFYDFRHLRHFFDYLAPAHSARIQERAARREARDEPPQRWHYQLLLHELLPQPDGGYTLVAEVYYPVYQYNNYGSPLGVGSMGYRPVVPVGSFGPNGYYHGNYSGQNLLGIRTSHVIVCGFDKRGNLLWDNTFVVGNNVMRTEVEQAVQALPLTDGRLALAYIADNEIHYKRIDQGEPSPNDAKTDIQTASPDAKEKVLDASQTDVAPWVNDQYVASGYQRIRPAHGPEREIFFLQLLKF
ncbi:MAG: hypothetical protein ACRYFX_21155 [Janthinobacterium lividum]